MKIETLTKKVKEFYESNKSKQTEFGTWLYENHVFVVVKNGEELSQRFGADVHIVTAAALVHDIADAVMNRHAPGFDEESIKIGRRFLEESGFDKDEIKIIIDDIVVNHSCRNGNVPSSLEGKVMSTADSLAHLNTDFYFAAIGFFAKRGDSREKTKDWALKNIDKNFNNKIFFDEVREEVRENYETIKKFFSL